MRNGKIADPHVGSYEEITKEEVSAQKIYNQLVFYS